MPNTRINRQKWKDHFSYAEKVYIIGILLALGAASLIYSVTRYQAPNERAVQIALVDSYTAPEKLDEIVPALLKAGQAFDDTLEEVQFLSIPYSGDGAADYEGAKVYTVQVYAGDNDIYIENKTMMEELIDQNYCVPLDTFEGFEEFTRRHPEVEVLYAVPGANQADGKESTEEDAPVEEPRPYALNISTLKGFAERGALNMKDKYAAVVIMSKNQETSFEVLSAMFDALAPSEEAVS